MVTKNAGTVGIFTIEGLASEAGVTVHQIQKWRKKGILSPVVQRGADPFVWTDTHLKQAMATRDILDNRMTLDDIRDYLHPLTEDEDSPDLSLDEREEDWSIDGA